MGANSKTSFLAISIVILSVALVPESIHMVSASPPYTWTGPTRVDQSPGLDLLPSVLQARNGTLWMAWQSSRFNQSFPKFDIFYKTRTGGLWNNPVNLTNVNLFSTGNNASPALAQFANDTVILFWSSLIGNSYKIVYEKYHVDKYGNEFWSNRIQLTSTNLNDTAPSATVARDGTLWLFWSRQNTTCTTTCTFKDQLYYKTVRNGAWSPDTKLTTNTSLNDGSSVMVGKDGILRLVWEERATAESNSQLFYNSYNGAIWGTESQVVSSSMPDAHPSIMQDRNGTIWLFWARLQGPVNQEAWAIYSKFSTNNGSTWSTESQITNDAYPVDDDNPAAIQSNTPTDKSIWVFIRSDRPNAVDFDIWALNSSPVSPVHDVKISTVAPLNCAQPCKKYPTPLKYAPVPQYANPVVNITVTVSNPGDFVESFSVTLTAMNTTSSSIGTLAGNVAIGGSTSVVFSWNTTGFKPGRYALSATVTVPIESVGNRGDDPLGVTNQVWILPLGDIDQDGLVSLIDVSVIFYDYGFSHNCGCSRWNPYADLNGNGIVDIVDAGVAARNYGITT
ncbi:hypothetical protein E6H27_00595 [Candidatus Bathyarchaeota archaeon]|nr:MAG: hypothetical protein E6H27_00595 [Candidatus Bathyarchaeota archaeon]TMI59878.1 MAG: hypothetical protein E6H14_02210 [Candidatus Bathyarchaeota archaeon]